MPMNRVLKRRTRRMAGIGGVVTILFVSHFSAAAGQAPKPCELLSKQVAQGIFGAPLDAGHETAMSCTYSAAGGSDEKGLMVNIIPASAASEGMSMAETYDNLIHQDPTATREPIGGLGEKAHFITSEDHTQAAVEVLYHNTIVGIMATSSPNGKLKAALIEAVRQMTQKL